MSKVTIEKDVPLPAKKSARYPWDEMQIGDSFVTMTKTNPTSSANINKMLAPKHFTCRRLPDGTGYRIWRDK